MLSDIDDTLKEETQAIENKILSEKLAKLSEENTSLKSEIERKDADLSALREETNTVRESEKIKGITQQKFDELQKKIDLLKRDLAKFVHGEGTLDALLADQKSSLEKDGLGFKLINKNAFGRGNQRSKMKYNMSYERCTDCSRRGHPSSKSILCALKNHFTNHFVRASPNIVRKSRKNEGYRSTEI